MDSIDSSPVANFKLSSSGKIPKFKLPSFRGNSLKGDNSMDDVVSTFTNHALSYNIADESFCEKNIHWSGAFDY